MQFSIFFIIGLLGYSYSAFENEDPRRYTSNFENVLGTSFEMKVIASSEAVADHAEWVALHEIDRLSGILSGYDTSSEFSRWQNTIGYPVPVSLELYEVLSLFDLWRLRTNGGLNASVQPLSILWKEAAKKQVLPSKQAIDNIVYQVSQLHWKLDLTSRTATHLSTVPLMTNTFVKSYIIKMAAEKVLQLKGIQSVMINIGGDIVLLGDGQDELRITDPLASAENDPPLSTINVGNKAVATSGNYRRGVMINGEWYSHIVDPRSGFPVTKVISATVVAANATDAGALATALNVLEPAEGIRLAESIPEIEYLVITKEGERILSKGWRNLEVPQNKITPSVTKKSADFSQVESLSFQESAELTINVELNTFAGRFRRPFVAVWVENYNKETVRTLALWFNKSRWLPDLKLWYHNNFTSYNTIETGLSSISSATRPPGAYALKWDMKDDKGNLVPPGKYTVYIEAAREHGTYQLIKQEIDCRNKSQTIQIKGNVEIAAASLEYKKAKK